MHINQRGLPLGEDVRVDQLAAQVGCCHPSPPCHPLPTCGAVMSLPPLPLEGTAPLCLQPINRALSVPLPLLSRRPPASPAPTWPTW